MQSHQYQFTPSSTFDTEILNKKSTTAKVAFEPMGAYVGASIKPGHDGIWTVCVDSVPASRTQAEDPKVVLHLTRGELGRLITSFELQSSDM